MNVAAFTLEDFWEMNGKLTYTVKTTGDLEEEFFDNEYRQDGSYTYDGLNEEGKATFNISESSVYIDDATILGRGFFIRTPLALQAGDSVEYTFEIIPVTMPVPVTIDFLIFEEEEFEKWLDPLTHGDAQATFSSSVSDIDTDVFNSTTEGTYFFVWHNDENQNTDSIYLHFLLEAEITKHPLIATITIDPITLETEEGEKIDDFAMDTSGWKIGDLVTIEILERPVDFTIAKEENLPIPINNFSVDIPTWVLEKIGYERTFLEADPYTIEADYTLWKSKYSGATLKSTEDIDLYTGTNTNSTLFGTTFSRFTVVGIENVTIVPQSSSFYLVPIMLGVLAAIAYRKLRKS
jgi:hypothetical protein